MNKKLFIKIGNATIITLLSCSLLFGCGKKDKNLGESDPTSSAQTGDQKDENRGKSATSKFGGDKKDSNIVSPTPKENADSGANNSSSNSANNYTSSANNNSTGGNSNNIPSMIESDLSEAKSLANAALWNDAQEILNDIDKNSLNAEQLTEYELIQEKIDNKKVSGEDDEPNYTPEEAKRIAEEYYGTTINLDTSGQKPQINSGGTEYYRMQVDLKSENLKKTINVYQNGEIEEILSEPLAYG